MTNIPGQKSLQKPFYILTIPQLMKTLPFYIPPALKEVPLSGEGSPYSPLDTRISPTHEIYMWQHIYYVKASSMVMGSWLNHHTWSFEMGSCDNTNWPDSANMQLRCYHDFMWSKYVYVSLRIILYTALTIQQDWWSVKGQEKDWIGKEYPGCY